MRDSPQGLIEYSRSNLPPYITVRVSAERWLVCRLMSPDEYTQPDYEPIGKPMSLSLAVNELTRLQRSVLSKNELGIIDREEVA